MTEEPLPAGITPETLTNSLRRAGALADGQLRTCP